MRPLRRDEMNFAPCAGFVRVQIVNWEAENDLWSKDHTTAPLRENESRMSYQCLLFDLDGTLVDSRADLINSVNLMLAELGRAKLPDTRVLNFVGEGARSLLEGIGLSPYFKVVIGGDCLPERKPSPLMLLEAARRCGVLASECLMIGDSRVDVEAGRAADMKTCGYIPGFRGRTELVEAGVDYVIERFSELCALVECARARSFF